MYIQMLLAVMTSIRMVVFSILLGEVFSCEDLTFPPGFKFGAATSSYQVEGAWNVSDKGPSIWDQFVHNKPSAIEDGSNGDVACNSYEFWRRDVEMTAELGLDYYRFSVSWPRLLPNGTSNYVSEDGKRYYNDLINGLLEVGVEPVVTLYHWDLPQTLQDLGGWTNPDISDWFADYASEVFTLYADRVKIWLTFNEAIVVCDFAYNTGVIAPGIKQTTIASFLCNKNILMAHAKAYRIYESKFKPRYNGKVSIANQLVWYSPETKDDETLTELVMEYTAGLYNHPIYSEEGGWPKPIQKKIGDVSLKEGYVRSRLPEFTKCEKEFVKGTFDFFAFNYYTSRIVSQGAPGEVNETSFFSGIAILDALLKPFPCDKHAYGDIFTIHPTGLRKLLNWVKDTYGVNEILISENGYSTGEDNMNDQNRIAFIREHLKQILLAIREDGINVTGYTYWSLLDNFEWFAGYLAKFGLYSVNFNDPLRRRTPRQSANYYSSIIKYRQLNTTITTDKN